MKSGTWTSRLVRSVALAALVATPVMLIATTGVAGATTVSSQDQLEDAFDSSTTTIDLTQNIVINSSGDANCDDFDRYESVSLVIDGHGFSITKNCPGYGERIFRQHDSGAITFQNVTVSGGVKEGGSGGALKTDGNVEVIDSTFHDNQALWCSSGFTSSDVDEQGCNYPYGGAIYSEGSVVVTGSTFADNLANELGGGIFTENNITVTDSTFSGNEATNYDSGCWGCSGGGFFAAGGADVSGSTITGNTAGCDYECDGLGGGFFAGNATSVVDSDVSGNTAGCIANCYGDGGGFFASGETANLASHLAEVGAAAADPGQVIVANSTINGNTAKCDTETVTMEQVKASYYDEIPCGSGGGFFSDEADSVSVDQSTLSGNHATCNPFVWEPSSAEYYFFCGAGGGFYSSYSDEISVNATTIDTNTASTYGGALSTGNRNNTVDIVNSTITANTSGASGAINVSGKGEVLRLTNDTIVQNVLDEIELNLASPASANDEDPSANVTASTLDSFGTIVALPIGGVNCYLWYGQDSIGSEQYNFSDDQSCGFIVSTDYVATPNDPSLLALGDYTGPTHTMRPTGLIEGGVLQNLSPVVDKIPAADCFVDVDQRGITRPQFVEADACDIGAVELTAEEITVSPADVVVPVPEVIQPKFTG